MSTGVRAPRTLQGCHRLTSSSPLPCTGEANEDYEDEDYVYDLPAADDPSAHWQPVTPLQLFEGRRNRRRREAPKAAEEQESRVQYTVCIWWVLGAGAGSGGQGGGRGSEAWHPAI